MNSSQPAGTPTTRLIEAASRFAHVICVVFSTCCQGTRMECKKKRRDCFKTSWANVDKGSLADCVVFNDVWAGLCRLATQRSLIENNLLR